MTLSLGGLGDLSTGRRVAAAPLAIVVVGGAVGVRVVVASIPGECER